MGAAAPLHWSPKSLKLSDSILWAFTNCFTLTDDGIRGEELSGVRVWSLKAGGVHYTCIFFQCDVRLQMTFTLTAFCEAQFIVCSHLCLWETISTPLCSSWMLHCTHKTAYGHIKYLNWGVAKSFLCLGLKAVWTPLTGHNLTHILILSNSNQKNKYNRRWQAAWNKITSDIEAPLLSPVFFLSLSLSSLKSHSSSRQPFKAEIREYKP